MFTLRPLYYKILLAFGFLCFVTIRLSPLITSNFYFTIDQGRDAIYARDILVQHKLPLLGPETSIPGLYHGVGWFYFNALAYALTFGHPAGPVILMILLVYSSIYLFTKKLESLISKLSVLGLLLSVSFYWPLYELTRYAFNPFLLFPVALIALSLSDHLIASFLISLTIHAHLTAALPIIFSWLIIRFIYRKSIPEFFIHIILISLGFMPHLLYEFTHNFTQTWALFHNQSEIVGLRMPFPVLLVPLLVLLVVNLKKNPWLTQTNFFMVLLSVVSFLFYVATNSWQDWHTAYLSPLLFLVNLVNLVNLVTNAYLRSLILVLSFLFSVVSFYIRFPGHKSEDPGLLATQLQTIKLIYFQTEGKPFNVYTYVPSVLDWHYQYLYWWYGQKKYGYLPCEYTTYPGTPSVFVPRFSQYVSKSDKCPTDLNFAVLEPNAKHPELAKNWLHEIQTILPEVKILHLHYQPSGSQP